jgi:hypothetical protein
MFVSSCHDWRLRLVPQCRVQITRIKGKCWESWVLCSQGEYSTHWETTIFIYYRIAKYVFYKSEPTICWQYVLDVLSSFNYVEVSMMFMRNNVWLKSVIWTDLKDLIVKCCNLNYGNIDWRIDVLNCLWIYIESMC